MLSSYFSHSRPLLSRLFSRKITEDDVSLKLKNVEYAVRGPIELRANEITAAINRGEKRNYDKLIYCNIGNPFAVGKPIITFPRQVLSVAEYPEIAKTVKFPQEVIDRANEYTNFSPATMGAYSCVQGHERVRHDIVEFLKKRDGFDGDPNMIYLTDGATSAIIELLHTIYHDKNDGIVLPIPQYPLYSALSSLFGATVVPYYLDEDKDWAFDLESLVKSVREAHDRGVRLKSMVVINPGNPTGTVLKVADMQKIIELCEEEGMILIADEVYQENVYGGAKWESFRKVSLQMKSRVQLVNLHSISKGFLGECGHRGGYIELQNIHEGVRKHLQKLFSLNICSNLAGQLLMGIAVRPPTGPICGKLWEFERKRELASLEKRAGYLYDVISKLPGLTSRRATGAMYLFPRIDMPKKAIEAARNSIFMGEVPEPDVFWSWKLMEEEGIVVTPGSGFGQKEGTHHFRITFLPAEGEMQEVAQRLKRFQHRFMEKYS